MDFSKFDCQKRKIEITNKSVSNVKSQETQMSSNDFAHIVPGKVVTWSAEGALAFGVVLSKDLTNGTCVVKTNDQTVTVELKLVSRLPAGCTGCGDMSRGGCLVFGSCGGGPPPS
jgi:hypothetical protein